MVQFTMISIGAVPGVAKKLLGPTMKVGFEKAGKFWQREILPIHFKRKAISRYGYRPREGDVGGKAPKLFIGRGGKPRRRKSYTTKKQEQFGHKLPLVWTGASRALSGTGKVTATKFRVTITVPAPNLNRRPETRREVVATVPGEIDAIIRILEKHIEFTFNRIRTRLIKKLF